MERAALGDKAAELAVAVARGERPALARALNLLDDRRPAARQLATDLLARLQSGDFQRDSHLIGMTGPPGAGKSTLSAALIRVWRQRGLGVGVLAVDPSSPLTGGALLGDRLRMQTSDTDEGVFVRSLACRGEFGGLSAEVWPMSLVMLAACDVVMIETVGVGQREIDVSRMADTTCFVAQPGSGDSVQFLKAGILEVPHVLVVNKEDMGAVARRTLAELGNALGRSHRDGNWQVPVLSTSAANGTGIEALADTLAQHHAILLRDGQLDTRRRSYQAHWIIKRLQQEFGTHGIARLGGENTLAARLVAEHQSLLDQYQAFRQCLLNPTYPEGGNTDHAQS
ncbi:MAG: methylmalonyl Co-A mutase-associated GTPase MeaB [Pseudomonadales bacterium]|nr:methylmalonyl Co-A mutase-associated GTPase MeaB [Halieaceae bacterium]MCP5164181.1 methylmalonyl Co-A mutase-associated GTPase MeaB [Pseudomonadales bacterium]MCP5190735.1 methylmalonyl Co-A mutase-associated GTPase MeaB [Pseudomonadales bacterium]MCP5203743.1 methylmalonyl Co-A mutase-associated GTPase MeaB [Pseudomonadales bacterium]